MKHYTMDFIMLQCSIPQSLNETRRLYETGCNLRQYGILITSHNVHSLSQCVGGLRDGNGPTSHMVN